MSEQKEPAFVWVCNECGASEFTDAIGELDLQWFACTTCGGDEFHKEPAKATQ